MRFTIAYWISAPGPMRNAAFSTFEGRFEAAKVMFLLGSIFFCVNACNKLLHAYGGRVVRVWPCLGVAFETSKPQMPRIFEASDAFT